MATSNADALAVAHQEIMKRIPDTLAVTNPFFGKMKNRKEVLEGGTGVIQFPISVFDNPDQGWITGTNDVIPTNLYQSTVYGQLNYKFFQSTASASLQDLEYTENSPNAVVSILKLKAGEALNTMVRTISQSLFQSGTTSNLQLNGLADVMAASGTAYAGVNNSTYSSWLPLYPTATVVNYNNINSAIQQLQTRIAQSPVSPTLTSNYKLDLMVSNYAVQSAFMNIMQTQQLFMADKATTDAGFANITVQGIPWVVDYYSPGSADGSTADNYLYILSMDSFHFGVRSGFGIGPDSSMDNTQKLPQQPMIVSTKYSSGNMWCENRRVNAAFKTLVA